MNKKSRKERIGFLLENNYYRKLHLYLYLATVFFIVLMYFFVIIFLKNSSIYVKLFFGIISLIVGVFMVYNRDKIVRYLSAKISERERKNNKRESKDSLKETIRRIVPRQKKVVLNIKPKFSFKEKMMSIKRKISSKPNDKSEEYLEYKD